MARCTYNNGTTLIVETNKRTNERLILIKWLKSGGEVKSKDNSLVVLL